jgi:hypothetical protein
MNNLRDFNNTFGAIPAALPILPTEKKEVSNQ